MSCRGMRGATTCDDNTERAILSAAEELVRAMIAANDICQEDVTAMFFTCSADLDAVFPARAVRQLGWTDAAMICAREIEVPGAPARCIRVLILAETERAASEVRHVYLHGAQVLRPDRVTATR